MPALKNNRHELFAQAIVRGDAARKAYRDNCSPNVSDTVADSAGSRLLNSVKVSARVAELRDRSETAEATVLTKTWVIEQTIALKRKAEAAGAYAPAVRCVELLGREVNAFIEKKEIGAPGEFADLKDDELVAIVRGAITSRAGEGRASRKGTGHTPDSETLQ